MVNRRLAIFLCVLSFTLGGSMGWYSNSPKKETRYEIVTLIGFVEQENTTGKPHTTEFVLKITQGEFYHLTIGDTVSQIELTKMAVINANTKLRTPSKLVGIKSHRNFEDYFLVLEIKK